MKSRGFVLTDSLLCVLIASLLALISFACFNQENIFFSNYDEYQEHIQEDYRQIYIRIGDCDLCDIKDS